MEPRLDLTKEYGLVLEDRRAQTDKEDRMRHGWGMRIIGQIAEKYGGTIRVENREGTVAVVVLLFRFSTGICAEASQIL